MKNWGERERHLQAIAENDQVYNLWRHYWENYAQEFAAFANAQPENIKNFLWGYADAGRLMQQRKVNLACENMEFIKK